MREGQRYGLYRVLFAPKIIARLIFVLRRVGVVEELADVIIFLMLEDKIGIGEGTRAFVIVVVAGLRLLESYGQRLYMLGLLIIRVWVWYLI